MKSIFAANIVFELQKPRLLENSIFQMDKLSKSYQRLINTVTLIENFVNISLYIVRQT